MEMIYRLLILALTHTRTYIQSVDTPSKEKNNLLPNLV